MNESNSFFSFDQVIDRTKSNSAKWDKHVLERRFGNPDLFSRIGAFSCCQVFRGKGAQVLSGLRLQIGRKTDRRDGIFDLHHSSRRVRQDAGGER